MTCKKNNNLSYINDFIEKLDKSLGAMPENEVDDFFDEFSSETQPFIIELVSSIAEENTVPEFFLAECIFHVVGLHRFYDEILGLTPACIQRDDLLSAIDSVELLLKQIDDTTDGPNHETYSRELPFLHHDILRRFFVIWQPRLETMREEGELDDDLYWDLFQFHLVILKAFSDKFPDAHH